MTPHLPLPASKISPLLLAVLSALLLLPSTGSGVELNVAVADVNKAFNAFYKTREATDAIQDELANARREINERLAKLKVLVEEINTLRKQASELSADLRAKKMQEGEAKIAEMQSLERQVAQHQERRERQIEEEQAEKRRDLFAQIYAVVGAKSKEGGFDFVIDKSGASLSQMPILLYINTDKIPDITDAVIEELNKTAPKNFIPGAPATSPEGLSADGPSVIPAGPVEPAGGS